VTRALSMVQLSGEHRFPALADAELGWNAGLSNATRYQPDTRDVVWGVGSGSPAYRFTEAGDSSRHFFADQYETQVGGGVDWTQPIIPRSDDLKLKLGGLVSLRERNFSARHFRYTRGASSPLFVCDSGDIDSCTDALFADGNIGETLELEEGTRQSDTYDATLNIFAGYLMTDAALTSDLRLIVGQRIEHTFQEIAPYDQFNPDVLPPSIKGATIEETALLPAVALVWSATESSKLRASATRTLARPQLRELAPFAFSDFFGTRLTSGNPDLKLTYITNLDLRFEHFPTLREVLAFSLFYKDFTDPIEPVIVNQGADGQLTFRNALGARLIGIELEARKNLGFVSSALNDFGLVSNLTLSQSKIQIGDEGVLDLTSPSRPLVNQAPYVLNLALDYTHEKLGLTARILYNVVGPRIVEVATNQLPDAYEHERGLLDFTVQQDLFEHFQLKLAARNLLNTEVLITQGCYSDGVFGSTWHLSCEKRPGTEVRRYTEGVSFALTAQYNH
jgi:TonB-dependent receptor